MAGVNVNGIFSATYSSVSARLLFPRVRLFSFLARLTSLQVPVYEFKIDGDSVMRRRSDDWINATHILKASGFDKPARTRILEREVQKGTHEKVQGGYGKYQGNEGPRHGFKLDCLSNGFRNMDSTSRGSFTCRAQ